MSVSRPLVAAVIFSVLSAPAFASPVQGPDIESSTRLSRKECLIMEAAKNQSSSRIQMENACRWASDQPDPRLISEKPFLLDSAPYGLQQPAAPASQR